MALPLKTMYDTFRDEIWKELGPLDPDWFEVLTAQTSANEASGSDQDELCANQEGHFKTPLDKTAVSSQPFSTPKVFRHRRIVSPETEDEQSFTAAQGKDKLPWTETQSPYLFHMSKQGVPGTKYGGSQPQSQHSFDLLDTPHKSPISYDKHISESLGAQMNPDISWTSSLNTPPHVPSTLILSKTDESTFPASVSADKNVVVSTQPGTDIQQTYLLQFVRKLFPSLSNASRVGEAPAINDDIPTDNYGAVLPEAVSPQTPLTQNGVWKKTLLDSRANGETCTTVADVADEPENVVSTFLANSSSALRKVKPDRVRQKRIKSNEHDCSATDIAITNGSNEEGKADEELGNVPSSSPVKPGSTGISQWSPLSLSQIPPCTADSNILTELQTASDSRQLVRPPLKIPDSGFIRKKRQFIYTVETLKPQVQENETDFQKMDTSPGIPDSGPELSSKQSADTTDVADCCSTVKNAEQKRENLPPSVQENIHDLDMSQLHRDFAQDFTQISDSGKLSKVVAEDQNCFSPSACLLAMKQDKQKRRRANLHHDCNGISNTGHLSTTSQNYSISEGTVSDSGFQSAAADITHTASSFIVPCLESTGSKADIHRTTPLPSTHKANGKSQLKERQTLNNERESQLDVESALTQLPSSPTGTVNGCNCIPLNGKAHGSLPEKTAVSVPPVHESGFRTASNKGIQISLASLEKARHLFEESESERTHRDQPTKYNRAAKQKNSLSNGSVKSTVSVSNQLPSVSERFEGVSCHLTASQKADVTELCILLEAADSQFEFTQFKSAEVKQPCPESACSLENADKDLDPDFLAGINFDDSFSSDAEKHLAVTVMPDMTCVSDEKSKGGASSITSKSTDILMSRAVEKENISAGDVLPSSEDIPGRSKCLMSTKPKSFHRAEHTEPSKMEQNPLMLDVAFKTAAGNALGVSNTCLSKARALFADLEINVSDLNSSDKQAAETDAKSEKMCREHSKTVTDDLRFTLKDNCHGKEKIPSFSNTKQTVSAFKQVTSIQDKYDTKGVENGKMDAISIVHMKSGNVNTGLGGPQPDGVERNGAGVLDLKTPASFHSFSTSKLLPCSASKITDSVTISELSSGDGFCTASGKKVSVSADAMKKAKYLLRDTYTLEDAGKKPSQTGQLAARNKESPLKTCGVQPARGEGVSISSTAHNKAENLLSKCDIEDDKIVVKPPHYKIPVHGPPPSNGGFLSASGKKIRLSSDALQKSKALFSDISFSAEIPVIPHTRNGGSCENTEKMQNCFTAAGGKVLTSEKIILKDFEDSVLTKAMQEAEDCDMSVNNGMSVKLESLEPVRGSGSEFEIRPDQRVTLNISVASANKQVKQKDTLPLQSGGFSTASGKKVSISSDALKRAKSLLGECDKVDDKINVNLSHLKTPVCGPLPKSGGFHAASGKPVALSPVALQKAKDLFSDIILDAESPVVPYPKHSDKNHENWKNTGKMPCGFKTAGGKKVHVSQKNLLEAKHLLEDFDDSILIKAMQEAEDCDMHVNGMSLKNKRVSPMSERCSEKKNLPETRPEQNATSSISVESGNGCTEDTHKHVEHKQDNLPLQSGGFQTASGKGVAISSEALRKAKSLLAECDEADDKVGVKPSCSKIPVHRSLPKNRGFRAASGKPVAVSSEALQRGKALFSDITLGAEIPHEKNSGENTGEMQSGFKTAVEEQVQVSQKNRVKEFDDLVSTKAIQEADGFTKDCDMDVNCGISVKYDNIAPVGDTSKDSKNGFTEVTNEHGRQKNTLQQQSGGFQTASGKEVIVSSEALKSAKTLLSECEGVDKTSLTPPNSKISVHGPPFRSGGFLSASGKPVALSSEAVQKAKELFSDGLSKYTPAAVHPRKNDKKTEAHNREKVQYGFTTAGGVKVHVSENSLLKATSLFKEFGDAECRDSLLFSTSSQDNQTLNQSKVKNVEGTSGSNFARVCDKDIPAEGSASLAVKSVPLSLLSSADYENETFESSSGPGCSSDNNKAPKDAFKFQEDTVTPSGAGAVQDCPEEEMPCMLDCEMNKVSSTKESKVLKADVLNFQSLDLAGCSETQQKFLAQEALDCTKALLEDEGLAGQSLMMILEDVPLQHNTKSNRSEEGEKIRRKRSAEDPEMTGQPPLKRRLLEEFDGTLVDPKVSTLKPVKSYPNGLMKDRGVFKYSTSLHPNITRPLSNGKNFMEPSFQKAPQTKNSNRGDGRSAHYKTPAFVPPFVRNAKAETHKNAVLKDNTRTPSAFVPPFKKQRTAVQKSPSKPQEGEDKHQKPFVMLFNSNSFVPPTKKTHGTADVTGLAATPTDSMNNQSLPADCGSVGAVERTSGVDGVCSRSRDVYQNLENTELARDMQDMRIRKKKRQNIRPLPGSFFLTKTSGVTRIPLKAAVNGKTPGTYTPNQLYGYGVQKYVSDITSDNAESFRFNLLQFIKQEAFTDGGGVQLADGGWLVPGSDGTAGKEEFYRALCDTPGVDPKLISDAWVYNHYRWIVWKQASMEKSFPEIVGSRCLTPEQVLLQLKYRYDVEVDHSRRPALRKIMEKDDTAVKTLVLCVCGIISRGHSPKRQSHSDTKTPHGADAKVETPAALIWLTDGWYAIKAQLDGPLTAMVHKGRLAVGGKLIINGAQLVGSQDACSPLEAPESLMLKICANSCRPARWDAKLGFHKDPRPFLLPVSSLHSNGGPVGCVDIVILRSYPIQWMERKPDGGVVFRSSRAEEKEARRYNSQKQKAMELVFAKIQAEIENEEMGNIKPQRRRKTISHQEIARLQDGEELHEAVGDDPAYLEAHLSAHQLEALHTYRRSVMEKKQAELQDRYRQALEAEDNQMNCPKREVTPVWRLCIADATEQPGRVYQLNLWRPSSDLQALLKEGCRYKAYNLTTSEAKKRSCVEAVQLTGTKKTQFQELQASQEWLSSYFHPRVSTNFVNLQNPDFQPLCGEVDLTGYVISVIDGQGSSPAFYLADEKLNFVKVRCFSSLSQSGLENTVKPHVILALSNLQLRGQSMHPTPVVYAGDLTSFSTNPREGHLQESLRQLKTLVQCQENFFVNAEEMLSHLVKSNGLSCSSSPALQRETSPSTADRRPDTKTSAISQKPARSLGSFTPVSRNPPASTSSAEKDPKSLKRKRALDYLSRIPSPPALSHLASVASPCVKNTFNPPRRSATPSTLKAVQMPSHKPTDSLGEEGWVNDEELAMIDTQALRVNLM